MTEKPVHFLFAISSHGYGHLSQVSPVINRLMQVYPDALLFIQTTLAQDIIAARIKHSFHYIHFEGDVGLIMNGAIKVRVQETRIAYQQFHDRWNEKFDQQTDILKQNAIDILIADIPYLPLLAAQSLNIKTIAICSLNWVDILSGYFQHDKIIEGYLDIMRSAYQQADIFLKPQPSMPMQWLVNSQTIQPLVNAGTESRSKLLLELSIPEDKKIILFALGGISTSISLKAWPVYKKFHFLVQDGYDSSADWVHNIKQLSLSISDIIQSVDLIITKPGYGIFVEAAFSGTPVLYVERGDWPEEIYLLKWLNKYLPVRKISPEDLLNGIEEPILEELLLSANKTIELSDGIEQAVNYITL